MFDFNIYQDTRFLNIIEDVYSLKRVNVLQDYSDKNITNFFTSKIKKSDIFNMPFNFYYSPSISEENKETLADTLKSYSNQTGMNILIKSLYNDNFLPHEIYANNPIIHLDNQLEYSKNHKQNIKRNTNKCNKLGIEIVKTDTYNDLHDFYNNVLSYVYTKKHKMIFQPFALYKRLLEEDLIDIFVAKKGADILGGIICLRDNETLHYNWGASLNYENIALGTILINHAIEYAREKNYRYFDMGSTALSDENLYDYKMKWSAINYPVYLYYTSQKPDLIDLNNSYKIAREVYSKMPPFFLRWLMPKIVPLLVQ